MASPASLGEVQDLFVLSDAPEFEQHRLDRLLATSNAEGTVRVASFHNVLLLRFSAGEVDRIYERLTRIPAPHRAGLDAERLARSWVMS